MQILNALPLLLLTNGIKLYAIQHLLMVKIGCLLTVSSELWTASSIVILIRKSFCNLILECLLKQLMFSFDLVFSNYTWPDT